MAAETPHHAGHRDRLRARFLKGGVDALADYELVEMLLFLAIPRRDVKPLAKQLLARFGGLAGLLNAPAEVLMREGPLPESAAVALKTVGAAAGLLLRAEFVGLPVLNSWDRLLDYLKATLAHETREHFRILFLNKKNELMADEVQQRGTVDHTPAYPREIVKRALDLGATALILVHNHPSGDPSPSKDDVDLTRAVVTAAKPLGIAIHDHVIVARKGCASLRNLGLM